MCWGGGDKRLEMAVESCLPLNAWINARLLLDFFFFKISIGWRKSQTLAGLSAVTEKGGGLYVLCCQIFFPIGEKKFSASCV